MSLIKQHLSTPATSAGVQSSSLTPVRPSLNDIRKTTEPSAAVKRAQRSVVLLEVGNSWASGIVLSTSGCTYSNLHRANTTAYSSLPSHPYKCPRCSALPQYQRCPSPSFGCQTIFFLMLQYVQRIPSCNSESPFECELRTLSRQLVSHGTRPICSSHHRPVLMWYVDVIGRIISAHR